jgi:hypothetical protein
MFSKGYYALHMKTFQLAIVKMDALNVGVFTAKELDTLLFVTDELSFRCSSFSMLRAKFAV